MVGSHADVGGEDIVVSSREAVGLRYRIVTVPCGDLVEPDMTILDRRMEIASVNIRESTLRTAVFAVKLVGKETVLTRLELVARRMLRLNSSVESPILSAVSCDQVHGKDQRHAEYPERGCSEQQFGDSLHD